MSEHILQKLRKKREITRITKSKEIQTKQKTIMQENNGLGVLLNFKRKMPVLFVNILEF